LTLSKVPQASVEKYIGKFRRASLVERRPDDLDAEAVVKINGGPESQRKKVTRSHRANQCPRPEDLAEAFGGFYNLKRRSFGLGGTKGERGVRPYRPEVKRIDGNFRNSQNERKRPWRERSWKRDLVKRGGGTRLETAPTWERGHLNCLKGERRRLWDQEWRGRS